MIDRSQFIEELRRNPDLVHRLAVINAGEVGGGNVPLEKQIIQLETVFNRAMSRGQTIEQVTRDLRTNPSSGYYPGTTIDNGERIMARPGAMDRFRELVFKPVQGGSDIGTEKLGFAPTGNASEGTNNFASRRAASGKYYSQSKWYGDPKKGGEMYVEEKGRLDRPERIAALRKGGPEPTTQVAGKPPAPDTAPSSTGQVAADMVRPNESAPGSAFEPTPGEQQFVTAGAEPSAAPPAPAAAPATAIARAPTTTTASARGPAPPALTLGERIIRREGPRGIDRSSYIDPNTGRQILNPGGSGEEAMGVTRDLGRPQATQTSRSPAARSTPRAGPPAPEAARAEEPVPLPRPRPADERMISAREVRDQGPTLDEGPTPPSAISRTPLQLAPKGMMEQFGFTQSPEPASPPFDPTFFDKTQLTQTRPFGGAPGAAEASTLAPPQAGFLSELFKNLQPQTSPAAAAERPLSPFEPGARQTPFTDASGLARTLAAPLPDAARTLPRSLEDPSASPAFGGTRPLSIAPGRTVDQQLMGLSPFVSPGSGSASQPTPAQVSMSDLGADPGRDTSSPVINAANLSPFDQQWPPWWDFGGGGGGYDFGGGGFSGEGFGGYGDFGAFA